jgi:hypothetical protein
MNPSIAPQNNAMLLRGVWSLLLAMSVATIVLLYVAYIPKNVNIISNPYLSKTMYARIVASLSAQKISSLPKNSLYAQIKKIISSAASIALSHDRPYNLTVFVDIMDPCAVVNNEYVLTTNGALVNLEEYAPDSINHLVHIGVKEQFFPQQSRIACSKWVKKLPVEIFENFSITWYARSHIELVPRERNFADLIFTTWYYTSFSPETMAVMEHVAQKNTRIDLRVPHYAIVSPILRGNL